MCLELFGRILRNIYVCCDIIRKMEILNLKLPRAELCQSSALGGLQNIKTLIIKYKYIYLFYI